MTRQEQINEAWCKYRGKFSTEIMQALAFALSWCDTHPAWISVEDELPPYSKQVLVYSENDPWAEMWWSERYTDGGARFGNGGMYQVLTDNNGFSTLRYDDNEPIQVTHWMLVEPPAKLSNLERSEKNRKEKKGGEE